MVLTGPGVKPVRSVETFSGVCGSKYEGEVKNGNMDGRGKFTMANNNIYIGEMKEGQFHGKGTLYFPQIGRYEGRWDRGKVIKGKYVFEDGLVYDERRWEYCPERDRSFYMGGEGDDEEDAGGESSPAQGVGAKPIEIPPGCYDVGDGYYHPKEGKIYTYKAEFIRQPSRDEADWITKNCTKNDIKFVNFNLD